MTSHITVTPFLWFDDDAEAALQRYLEVFDTTELLSEQRHPDGSLFIAEISLQGQRLTLMNGGPHYRLTEGFSLAVSVETSRRSTTSPRRCSRAVGRSSSVGGSSTRSACHGRSSPPRCSGCLPTRTERPPGAHRPP
jgi:predicted 3-demethylubiquinone-9 3-methyltransferase (glyoxalase superfamily)